MRTTGMSYHWPLTLQKQSHMNFILVSVLSLPSPLLFGRRKEAFLWLAALTSHNFELREHFPGTNSSHNYNIFFCSQNAHRHICHFLTSFSWRFFLGHIFRDCLWVPCLQYLVPGIQVFACSGSWSRTSHAVIAACPWLKLSFIWPDSMPFDVNESLSMTSQHLGPGLC